MDNASIKKLEADLWESADLLRAGSKLTSNQYCMPVLGLLFLRYAYSRYKMVEEKILKDRPVRNGRKMPVEASDFTAKSALFLPEMAQFDYLVNLPENVASLGLLNVSGQTMGSLGEVVNNAMELVEQQSDQLTGVLPKSYTDFSDELLGELLRIFNNSALDEVGGDVIGRIYEYFLNKFAKNIASDDGVFFTPKSLVKMIVNILEPKSGVLLDPACGSGGMFVQTGDFVNETGLQANKSMTFYGQEKVEYNAQLCLMNMAVHGLTGVIKSGDEANSFYHDAHHLEGKCNYVMANPPFNVDKVKAETAANAGRLPFGVPKENKNKEIGNANYLWISYFYAYLNETGRAGFVMASSATDSQGSDKDMMKYLDRDDISKADRERKDAIIAIVDELKKKKKHVDNTDLMVQINGILGDYIMIERAADDRGFAKRFDISKIDFDLLRREFAKVKKKNLAFMDLDELIQVRLDAMIRENPRRVDYYIRYQQIIEEYNSEQDRANIEKTFMELMDLANSMNEEEQRYVREGFSSDEELSMYDMLFDENLSKEDIKKIKKVAVDLLDKIKTKIAELDHCCIWEHWSW